MNNFTSVVIALFEHLELLTADEAKKLAKELHTATLPDDYANCSKLLADLCQRLDIKPASYKIKSLTSKA